MVLYREWLVGVLFAAGLCIGAARAEDIDIFVGTPAVDSSLPNVIFVLDNTSNWAKQSQQWPGQLQQGQSEVLAIQQALSGLTDKINVGLVEFTTRGNANQNGGFVRFDLQKLTTFSQSNLNRTLDVIYNNINADQEKRNANTAYGNLMYDVYNYLAGIEQSFDGGGTPKCPNDCPLLPDPGAYADQQNFSLFASPLTTGNICGKTYLIFIGNPNQSGPASDYDPSGDINTPALQALYSAAGTSPPNGLAGTSGAPSPLPLPTVTVTPVTEPLGLSGDCYANNAQGIAACTTKENSSGGKCFGKTACSCSTPATSCSGGKKKYQVVAVTGSSVTLSKTLDTTSGRSWNLDDWSKYLHDYGVSFEYTNEVGTRLTERASITTYTIDVFNAQPNDKHSALLYSAADVGGGRYFQAKSQGEIVTAITNVLGDILSVSSTFAAVTLPLSATNRAQQQNQVFIGMFRPDQEAKPRWFGNLKRYQLGLFNGVPQLADKNLNQAVNPLTGFAAECAESFWTTDSNAYWQSLGISPPPLGQCLDSAKTTSDWSDLPDGPFVEKGGIAQVTRARQPSTRKLMTVVSETSDRLVDVTPGSAVETSTAAAMGSPDVLRYLRGGTPGVDETLGATPGRPSIHGDVIHSRPLTITYGGTGGIYVFYGANDGLFRAINAADGSEAWSLVAPEHFSGIKRLYDNSPTVAFPNSSPTVSPKPQKKGYFFDGSIGQVVRVNASNEVELAYIYPTMRRGGRMVYALDVTTPTSPRLLWRQGCPNLANDTGCSEGFSGIGQTWSTPKSGYPKGYTDGGKAQPILIFGGGYDTCLDTDSAAYPTAGCAEAKGLGIYVLDAKKGAVLRGPTDLPTDAPVVAELSTLDIDFDGYVDYAYAADAKGNLYRIDFSSLTSDNLSSLTPLDVEDWSIKKIATTSNPEHRFLNQPVVGSFNAVVYVALGSGNRERPLEINYPYAEDVDDRFYAFIDFPYDSSVTPIDLNGSDLVDVTYDPASPPPAEECNPQGNRGWYTRLTGQGEQVVNPAAIAGGKVFFNSYQPGGASVGGLCSRPLGIGTGYQFSLFNPTRCENPATRIVGPGMPIPPIITTVKIPDTDCDGPDCKPVTVTLCIGCEGFEPVEIEPVTDPIRAKVYWNSDIDR